MNQNLRTPPILGLRRAQADFVKAAGTRRALAREFHLGIPGGEHLTLPDDADLDAGLRADVVERALDGIDRQHVPQPVPWITRSGELVAGDADYAWMTASMEGFGRHSLTVPGFFVITRYGWIDLVAGHLVQTGRIRP
jgi:hypothetical protein